MSAAGHPTKVCFGEVCYTIIEWPPIKWNPPAVVEGEETGHYAHLFSDVSVLQSIHQAAMRISDSGTRAALESGIASAVYAMEKRGAEQKVKITLGD